MHFYTTKEIEYLREISPGRSNEKITEMFNKRFDLDQSKKAISAIRKKYKISTGLTGQFEKGSIPWNKGIKGLQIGGKETQFKKGNIPKKYRPVGSERINADGYIEIKIADPNKWRAKHIVIWEEKNGPLPKGHAILFGDADKSNIDINNLILVTRAELLVMNRNNLIKNDFEITNTGLNIARLYRKIGERKR